MKFIIHHWKCMLRNVVMHYFAWNAILYLLFTWRWFFCCIYFFRKNSFYIKYFLSVYIRRLQIIFLNFKKCFFFFLIGIFLLIKGLFLSSTCKFDWHHSSNFSQFSTGLFDEFIICIHLSRDMKVDLCWVKFQFFCGETGVTSPGRKPQRWNTVALRYSDYMAPTLDTTSISKGIEVTTFGEASVEGIAGNLSMLAADRLRSFTMDFVFGYNSIVFFMFGYVCKVAEV